jgi:hypothetical protein
VTALAERYHKLPHEVLQCTPGELYLNLLLSFPGAAPSIPRQRTPDDPSLTELLARLNVGQDHNG